MLDWWRRWRRRRADAQRARLADDADRVAGAMTMVLADAARLKVPIPEAIGACSLVWSSWAARIRG